MSLRYLNYRLNQMNQMNLNCLMFLKYHYLKYLMSLMSPKYLNCLTYHLLLKHHQGLLSKKYMYQTQLFYLVQQILVLLLMSCKK